MPDTTLHDRIRQLEDLLTSEAPETDVLRSFERLVDAAEDADDEAALVRATELASAVELACTGANACWARYCHANAWSALRHFRTCPAHTLSWEQPELLKEVLYLRSALQHEGFTQLEPYRGAQLHCNLGNAFSRTGRIIDAIEHWELALTLNPVLAMARGNLGEGLGHYASTLYDDGHMELLFRQSRVQLVNAVEIGLGRDGATYEEALEHFEQVLAFVDDLLASNNASPDDDMSWIHSFSMGRSPAERSYRHWCLERKLFLNPLNDAYIGSIAAEDVLSLPDHAADEAGITYLAFFNQLKQEFVYARWCLYDGAASNKPHLADRGVRLAANADYATYSVSLEQVKTAFRAAYSLMDKVAYFVNDYWKLEIPEKQVDFSSIWTEKKKPLAGQIRATLENSQNWSLQALYWLSRDFYDEEFHKVAAPDAQALRDLRNHLEHKFLKVVEINSSAQEADLFLDHLSYQVTPDELVAKTERILRLSRSALIYLCTAMHRQETLRPSDGKTRISLPVEDIPDDHKQPAPRYFD